MNKFLYFALVILCHQIVGASDAKNEELIEQVRKQCGNPGKLDRYHAEELRSVPGPVLEKLVAQGCFINCLAKGSRHGSTNSLKEYERDIRPRIYHHVEEYVYNGVTLCLDGHGLVFVPPQLGLLATLISVDLSNNNLTSFPGVLLSLTQLKALLLTSNRICTLPEEMGGLETLRSLALDENPLVELPHSIVNLTRLERLYLTPSQIAGNLPLLLKLQEAQINLDTKPVSILGYDSSIFDLTRLDFVEVVQTDTTIAKPNDPAGETVAAQKCRGEWYSIISSPIEED